MAFHESCVHQALYRVDILIERHVPESLFQGLRSDLSGFLRTGLPTHAVEYANQTFFARNTPVVVVILMKQRSPRFACNFKTRSGQRFTLY